MLLVIARHLFIRISLSFEISVFFHALNLLLIFRCHVLLFWEIAANSIYVPATAGTLIESTTISKKLQNTILVFEVFFQPKGD